jgi:hypothetical protein
MMFFFGEIGYLLGMTTAQIQEMSSTKVLFNELKNNFSSLFGIQQWDYLGQFRCIACKILQNIKRWR